MKLLLGCFTFQQKVRRKQTKLQAKFQRQKKTIKKKTIEISSCCMFPLHVSCFLFFFGFSFYSFCLFSAFWPFFSTQLPFRRLFFGSLFHAFPLFWFVSAVFALLLAVVFNFFPFWLAFFVGFVLLLCPRLLDFHFVHAHQFCLIELKNVFERLLNGLLHDFLQVHPNVNSPWPLFGAEGLQDSGCD